MPDSLVILNTLLPIGTVQLGRLVVDMRFPDQDFFQSAELSISDDDVSTQRLEEFSYASEQTKTSDIRVLLSVIISGSRGSESSSGIDISTPIFVTRQLKNSGQFFEKLCSLRTTRAWLERMLRRRKSVYVVTGMQTVANAQIGRTRKTGTTYEGNVQIPGSLATFAAGIPLPVPEGALDVGAGGARAAEDSQRTSFVAPGEHLFAVQYRKMRISWLSSRDVDKTYLESGNRWKMYIGGRGEEDQTEHIVDVELGDYAQKEDLARICDVVNVSGQEYVCFK
ncbi:hypothetical protein LA080_015262 [Diaporthe eres]|uniref:Uncharacterized protein n=1 Tax=Diaporthe vaccinii TaxID=105482 RepID=A0ABR4EEP4_9PEZI|nr:hypothetical protein LA080_015262 [Diaporthe eres]